MRVLAVVLAAAALAAAAVARVRARFERAVEGEARGLLAAARAPDAARRGDPAALPPVVRAYLERVGALGRVPLRAVALRHGGRFRPGLDAAWKPIRGRQWLAADPPGFLWWGRIAVLPGVSVDGVDTSRDGAARLRVRALGAVPLGDAAGPDLDTSALLRLLGELLWMPTAYADGRYVTWSPGPDPRSAFATLRVGGRAVQALFRFGEDGLPVRYEALRARDLGGGRSVDTPFHGDASDWRTEHGLLVPHRLRGVWVVEGREVPYADFVVERLEPDPAR